MMRKRRASVGYDVRAGGLSADLSGPVTDGAASGHFDKPGYGCRKYRIGRFSAPKGTKQADRKPTGVFGLRRFRRARSRSKNIFDGHRASLDSRSASGTVRGRPQCYGKTESENRGHAVWFRRIEGDKLTTSCSPKTRIDQRTSARARAGHPRIQNAKTTSGAEERASRDHRLQVRHRVKHVNRIQQGGAQTRPDLNRRARCS